MFDLLTPIALAHWIMGDGAWNHSGVVLCTDSFSIEDNVKLINILIVRYQLDCTLRCSENRIYILGGPLLHQCRLRSIVLPYMTILYYIRLVISSRLEKIP